jgi:hypothetical protein
LVRAKTRMAAIPTASTMAMMAMAFGINGSLDTG